MDKHLIGCERRVANEGQISSPALRHHRYRPLDRAILFAAFFFQSRRGAACNRCSKEDARRPRRAAGGTQNWLHPSHSLDISTHVGICVQPDRLQPRRDGRYVQIALRLDYRQPLATQAICNHLVRAGQPARDFIHDQSPAVEPVDDTGGRTSLIGMKMKRNLHSFNGPTIFSGTLVANSGLKIFASSGASTSSYS